MGWWSAVWTVVTDVANGFEDLCNDAGDAISDLAETGQNLIQDGFDAIGDALGATALFHAIGVWLAAPLGMLGVVIKGAFNIVGGFYGGIVKMLAAVMTLNGSLFVEGLFDLASPIAGAVLVLTGEIVAYLQGAFIFVSERPLTPEERIQMERIFRGSIAYYNIRVIEGWSGVALASRNRAFTVGNRIYVKTGTLDELAHECTHVWQYQHLGARYASDAIWTQFFGMGYDWRTAVMNGTTRWLDLSRESQGELIQVTWRDEGLWTDGVGKEWHNGVYFDAEPPHTVGIWNENDIVAGVPIADKAVAIANDAIVTIRGARSLRVSQLL